MEVFSFTTREISNGIEAITSAGFSPRLLHTSEGVGTSEMVVELDVSTEYFLVTTGYEKQHFGSFVNSIQGSGTITCTSLNIEENTIESFTFYPNPTSELLNIRANTILD
jgi:hypothetical protein